MEYITGGTGCFCPSSQDKYFAAKEENKWDDEITAVEIYSNGLVNWVVNDEHPRQTSMEKLAALKPAFAKDGTVTAGNSSGINDGAAAMLLASEEAVKKYGLKPMAKIVSMAVAGVDPGNHGDRACAGHTKSIGKSGSDKLTKLTWLNLMKLLLPIHCLHS